MDAPETLQPDQTSGRINKPGQHYGKESWKALEGKINRKRVKIDIVHIDQYMRMVAIVWLDNRNINLEMVKEGYAAEYTEFLKEPFKSQFLSAQREARSEKRRIWGLPDYERPRDFKKRLQISEGGREGGSMNKTIIMIHGMWGRGWYWENYKNYFEAKGYKCIVPTLRYHDVNPQSSPPAELGTTSILDYASDLEILIKETGGKPILMGHSMGGLIAQILGSRDLAESLVLLTPASPRGIIALTPSVIKSFWSVLFRWAFWKTPMRQTFEEAVYAMLHLLPPEQQKQAYERFVSESGRAAFEIGFWLLDSKKATQVDEKKVTCPVLVIAGAEDRITPACVVKKVHEKYGGRSTYKELSGHAHWVVGEPGWEDIAALIHEWLDQNIK